MVTGARSSRRAPPAAALAAVAALGLAVAPAAASAAVLGIVYPESCSIYDAATDSLRRHLAANGFGEGALEVYVQKPSADPMSWANALRKFDAVEADLIVVWGDALLHTACREKIRRPVGYGLVLEPGLSSCARGPASPRGGATGVSAKTPLATLIAKARLMTEFRTVGVLRLPGDELAGTLSAELRDIGKGLGFTVREVPVGRREEAVAAFRSAAAEIGLLLMPACPLAAGQADELLAAAAELRVPTASLQPPRSSGSAPLLSLYASPEEQGRILGEIAVAILRGGPNAGPPAPAQPKAIELELNLQLARQLGLKTPMSLLETTTRVIK